MSLTLEEKATNYETMRHIQDVQKFIHRVVTELLRRAEKHDQVKMSSPEVEAFTKFTDRLATCTYGSEEYNGYRKELKPALDHHYANSRHHPEHFEFGVDGMNLIDVVEMFCDWKAASLRHNDGNILKSIEINSNRFDLSNQLQNILRNTAELFD